MGVSLALFSGTHGRGLGSCVKPSGFSKKAGPGICGVACFILACLKLYLAPTVPNVP
jgi:hypothetical protein